MTGITQTIINRRADRAWRHACRTGSQAKYIDYAYWLAKNALTRQEVMIAQALIDRIEK